MLHMAVSWSHTYIQHNQHTSLYAFRIPLTFRSATKTTCTNTERGSEERRVIDTHHASRRQCRRIRTCSYSFGTCSLARSAVLHMNVSWKHTYFQHNQHTPLYAARLLTDVPRCYENDARHYRTWQWRAYTYRY